MKPLLINGFLHLTPTPIAFVTGQTVGSTRNNYSGFVGFGFTIGLSNVTVTDLGRYVISGNSGTHVIKITTTANVTVISGSLNTVGVTAGTYGFVSVTPTVLSAATSYFIFTEEVSAGDFWYDNSPITSTAAGTITSSAYIAGTIMPDNLGSTGYGFPSFKYT